MALGLEQALAEFLSTPPPPTPSFGGLYDDADPANRIIFIDEQPPIPTDLTSDPNALGGYITTAQLAITVFTDGGAPPQLLLGEEWTITIQCRHPSMETAMETQRSIYSLHQQNGGQSNGANPLAQGQFGGIKIWQISADFPELRLGRDRDGEDGRYQMTQSFTVRTKPITFT